MTTFGYCPKCCIPSASRWWRPLASRLGRTSRKRGQEWHLITPCCEHSRKLLPTAPRTEAMLATDAAKWKEDRWTGDVDPLGCKRAQIEEREAREQRILEGDNT